jgi:hypothetical protein
LTRNGQSARRSHRAPLRSLFVGRRDMRAALQLTVSWRPSAGDRARTLTIGYRVQRRRYNTVELKEGVKNGYGFDEDFGRCAFIGLAFDSATPIGGVEADLATDFRSRIGLPFATTRY